MSVRLQRVWGLQWRKACPELKGCEALSGMLWSKSFCWGGGGGLSQSEDTG